MSLLLANGHPDAMHYTIGRVSDEAGFVVERQNGVFVTTAIIIQAATATTGMAASRKSQESFKKLVRGLSGE